MKHPHTIAVALVLAALGVFASGPAAPAAGPVAADERVLFEGIALSGAGEAVRESALETLDLHALSALGARWEAELPEGTSFELAYRFFADASWAPLRADADVDGARDDEPLADHEHTHEGTQYSDMVVGRGTTVQLRASLRSSGPAAAVRDVTVLGYHAPSTTTRGWAAARAATSVITRAEWGADESYRVYNPNRPAKGGGAGISDEARAKLGDEIATEEGASRDEQGNRLTWPVERSKTIRKIILHHTSSAQPASPDEAVAYLRSVYYFHTITRGWGDIGYNYIVDPFGNVYEGRAGGPRAVGAHAANYNVGSIGISVMGSYSEAAVTPEAKRALVQLVGEVATREGIDPAGVGSFRERMLANVLGHRDVGRTDCPGDLLWAELPSIRTLAAQPTTDAADPRWRPTLQPGLPTPRMLPTLPPRFDERYLTDLEERLDTLEEDLALEASAGVALRPTGNPQSVLVAPGGRTTVRLSYVNDGTAPLTANTFLSLDARFAGLAVGDGGDIASRLGSEIAPGGRATFEVPVALDAAARGTFELQLVPVANGVRPMLSAASRLRVIADESGLGLVDWVAGVARSRGTELLTSFLGVPLPTLSTASEELDVEAPVRSTPASTMQGLSTSEAAPDAPRAAAPLPERFTLKAVPLPKPRALLVQPVDAEKPLRVRLSHAPAQELTVSSDHGLRIVAEGEEPLVLRAKEQAAVTRVDAEVRIEAAGRSIRSRTVRLEATTGSILSIDNWTRPKEESFSPDDRRFRGTLELRAPAGKLLVINELPIEAYLKGLAEPNPKDPAEKIKALVIVARTYATFYRDSARKFPGEPFDLDDDPAVSQRYLGAAFETRAPEVASAVDATRGQVVMHEGRLVKTPYFSSSDGRTRSAQEVWGWSDTPWLASVPDPCTSPVLRGHGVGLSGCGARVLAEQGKTADEILKYFYRGVEITPSST